MPDYVAKAPVPDYETMEGQCPDNVRPAVPAGRADPGPSPLLMADAAVLACSGQKDGSLRVVYSGWPDAAIFKPGEVLELRCEQGQVWAYRRGCPTNTQQIRP